MIVDIYNHNSCQLDYFLDQRNICYQDYLKNKTYTFLINSLLFIQQL